jgi:pimeloyl-ACP methyl ester carboxylesterase
MGLPAFPGAQLLVFWGSVQCGFNGFAHDPAEYARSVDGRVLLLHGEADVRVTQAQAEAIYRNLAGDKQLVTLAGAGHDSYLATDPSAWKAAVRRFLAGRARTNVLPTTGS